MKDHRAYYAPLRGALLGGALLLALNGCSAITSTTNVAADAAETVANGVSKASRGTTNASVTEPDIPRHQAAVAFVDSQRAQLQREAATGGGEHVDALARLLGNSDGATLGPWLQAHYSQVFTADDDARALVARIAARRG